MTTPSSADRVVLWVFAAFAISGGIWPIRAIYCLIAERFSLFPNSTKAVWSEFGLRLGLGFGEFGTGLLLIQGLAFGWPAGLALGVVLGVALASAWACWGRHQFPEGVVEGTVLLSVLLWIPPLLGVAAQWLPGRIAG